MTTRPAEGVSRDVVQPHEGGELMSGTRAPGWPGGLTAEVAALVRERFGTPCYVYDRAGLEAAARQALAVPAPYGLTLRYAMKANPNHGILDLFRDLGLHVDASSDFEVERALRAGFPPSASSSPRRCPRAGSPSMYDAGSSSTRARSISSTSTARSRRAARSPYTSTQAWEAGRRSAPIPAAPPRASA